LYVPEVLVPEKIQILEELGATVIKCPVVPPDHAEFVNNLARLYAEQNENAYHVNQMDNTANRNAHFTTTGPEIWRQTEGNIDGFIVGAGTSGTFSGVSQFLKTKNPNVKTYFADREGSGIYSYITSKGANWDAEGTSFVEGIGKLAPTGNMADALELADGAIRILDGEVITTIYNLIHEEGISPGASGGLNIAAARKLALTLPEGATVVTTVADTSERYASKLFNKEWLIEKGHWEGIPKHLQYLANYEA
jgi:cysteine synthase A